MSTKRLPTWVSVLIAAVIIIAVTALGVNLNTVFTNVANTIGGA